jgi:hypothetical protein
VLLELTSDWADTQIQETLTVRRRPPSARPNNAPPFLPSSVQGSGGKFSVESQQQLQSCSTYVQHLMNIHRQHVYIHVFVRSLASSASCCNTPVCLTDRNKHLKS